MPGAHPDPRECVINNLLNVLSVTDGAPQKTGKSEVVAVIESL
jgi:hypothetical protein